MLSEECRCCATYFSKSAVALYRSQLRHACPTADCRLALWCSELMNPCRVRVNTARETGSISVEPGAYMSRYKFCIFVDSSIQSRRLAYEATSAWNSVQAADLVVRILSTIPLTWSRKSCRFHEPCNPSRLSTHPYSLGSSSDTRPVKLPTTIWSCTGNRVWKSV